MLMMLLVTSLTNVSDNEFIDDETQIDNSVAHPATRRPGDVVTTCLCTSQRRRSYVANETPNDVSMESRQDVSVVRLHNILLERCEDVLRERKNDVSSVRLHNVSNKS